MRGRGRIQLLMSNRLRRVVLGILPFGALIAAPDPAPGQSRGDPDLGYFLFWDAVQGEASLAMALFGGPDLSVQLAAGAATLDGEAWVDALGSLAALSLDLSTSAILRSEGVFWVRKRGVGVRLEGTLPLFDGPGWDGALQLGTSAGGVLFPAYSDGEPALVKRARADAGLLLETPSERLEVGFQVIRAVADASDYAAVVNSTENVATLLVGTAAFRVAPAWSISLESAEGAPGGTQLVLGVSWSPSGRQSFHSR